MHELNITKDMLKVVLWEARKSRAKRINRILLKIGEYSSMMPEYIQYYFYQISQNTIAAKAVLDIERTALELKCNRCGSHQIQDELAFRCAFCENTEMEVIRGMEFQIDSIEIE